MKNLTVVFALFLGAFLTSCGVGDSSAAKKITGEWTLTQLEKEGEGAIELKDCDKQTKWNFTKEKAEPLGDGTEVMKVVAKAPEGCKFFGFDSKWMMKDGQLFISSVKVGGMGGSSNAGMFNIVESTPNKMVLKIMSNTYTLTR